MFRIFEGEDRVGKNRENERNDWLRIFFHPIKKVELLSVTKVVLTCARHHYSFYIYYIY